MPENKNINKASMFPQIYIYYNAQNPNMIKPVIQEHEVQGVYPADQTNQVKPKTVYCL